MGFLKKVKVSNKEITLRHNLMTYILYRNFTGRDLLDDTMKIGIRSKPLECLLGKDAKDLSPDELEKLSSALLGGDTGFYLMNLTAALVATEYQFQKKPFTFEGIIESLPDDLMYDTNFMTNLTEFITVYVEGIKKKVGAV